jgi:6-phosphogluconolactonase
VERKGAKGWKPQRRQDEETRSQLDCFASRKSMTKPKPKVIVAENREELVQAARELVLAAAARALAERGRFTLALAGGSTPRPLYQALAATPGIDWDRWLLFFGDERTVPPGHEESNYRMVKEAWLDPLTAAGGSAGPLLFRMAGEEEPTTASLVYANKIQANVPAVPQAGTGRRPRFDLILLGMGADGHTASLFPGTSALHERRRLVVANLVPQLATTRLTFTYPLLNAARAILFLVSGADKATALRAVLGTEDQRLRYPSQGVRPRRGTVTWLVDRAAGGG